MEEIWKDIKGYENKYQVSSFGNVRSIIFNNCTVNNKKRIKKLNPAKDAVGYLCVVLCKGGKAKTFRIHKLVSQAFLVNENNYKVVNHIDGNKLNNRVDNLEWCTYSGNSIHAVKNNLIKSGEQSPIAKLKDCQILFIKKHYKFRDKTFNSCKLAKMFGVSQPTISMIINNSNKSRRYQCQY